MRLVVKRDRMYVATGLSAERSAPLPRGKAADQGVVSQRPWAVWSNPGAGGLGSGGLVGAVLAAAWRAGCFGLAQAMLVRDGIYTEQHTALTRRPFRPEPNDQDWVSMLIVTREDRS
ncbi:hypothetical protein ADK54_34855 [Streptomyces sp. WM6378]|nr:hypothetical protein ADK54_34855 [Streptomyces sp. WM6378]